ncbi:MAG: hypothetical protein J6D53_00445 [Blautia sp.]|nr:hypothetical protein [Blautia sp.]
MNEKHYNTIGVTGAGSLVIGILMTVFGIAAGVIMIVNGGRLLHIKKDVLI